MRRRSVQVRKDHITDKNIFYKGARLVTVVVLTISVWHLLKFEKLYCRILIQTRACLFNYRGSLGLFRKVGCQWEGYGAGTLFSFVFFDLLYLRCRYISQFSVLYCLSHGPEERSCKPGCLLRIVLWEAYLER